MTPMPAMSNARDKSNFGNMVAFRPVGFPRRGAISTANAMQPTYNGRAGRC